MRRRDPIKYLCACIYEKVDEGFCIKKRNHEVENETKERCSCVDILYIHTTQSIRLILFP
jgi:hypothetical protein